jgi:prevent-host-death family protein
MTIVTRRERHMQTDVWTVAEAKARFSELIDKARSDGPQTITRKGRTAVVVVAAEEWEKKTRRSGNIAEFFAASPLRRSKLRVERIKGGLRKADF